MKYACRWACSAETSTSLMSSLKNAYVFPKVPHCFSWETPPKPSMAYGPVLSKRSWKTHPARCKSPASCRSEEHTSELQSLMRISYAVYCLKKKKNHTSKLH